MVSFVIRRILGLTPSALLFLSAGCADIRSYCQDVTDCHNDNDDAKKACVAEMKGNRAAADEYGCRDEFDKFVACYLEYGECRNTGSGSEGVFTTLDEETGIDMCASVVSALNGCGAIESRNGYWW